MKILHNLGWTPYSNIIEDSLYRYFHTSDESQTYIPKPLLPPHIVDFFHIKPLSRDITSCFFLIAASLTQPNESTKPLRPRIMETGTYGAP